MKIIGLTGGIGSGKSTVAAVFSSLGVPVYEADDAARRLQETDDELKAAMRKAFGNSVFSADGDLDRRAMAALVFSSPEKLALLSSIIHPAVARDFENWKQQHQHSVYVIRVAAILFEAGADKDCDAVITVVAPSEIRVQRVMQRDKVTKEQVLERMKRQMSDEERMRRSAYSVRNDESELVLPQVLKLHEIFSAK